MQDPIESKVNSWTQNGETKYSEINLRIIHLDERLFSDYEPTNFGSDSNFMIRLAKWLENIEDEEDQKKLFELVPNIFFVGREELNVLYKEAYKTNFSRWLLDHLEIDFLSTTINEDVKNAITNTWFCPLTDSLRINQFYHINDIPGKHDYRPDWRSLYQFGDTEKIKKYIEDEKIERIVLLEDFIGNGGQVSKAVELAAKVTQIPILIIPLIICPKGVENAHKLEEKHPNIKVHPVISIPQKCFVAEEIKNVESTFHGAIHSLASKTYTQVADSTIIDDNIDPYGPLGWRKSGAIIVMHTNTPNNTLPLIHNKSQTWNPLFKRHKRV